MTNLRKLGLSFMLIAVLFTAVFAGETPTPPCIPGETNAPPCVAQSVNDDSPVLGETEGPPALTMINVTHIAETMLSLLLLF